LQSHSVYRSFFFRQFCQGAKTNAQKKWAVKTRPFGREGRIVTRQIPPRKPLTGPKATSTAYILPTTA
jgi:hypothetical protein